MNSGIGGQSAGDADALPLAARELVRETVDVPLAQAYHFQELCDPLCLLLPAADQLVHAQRLADDGVHRPARVQRGKRVLEDHLRLAPNGQPVLALGIDDVVSIDLDLAVGRRVEAQHGAPDRGLAAAALAHQAQRLAAVDKERDAVDGLDRPDLALDQDAAPDGKVLLELRDLDEAVWTGWSYLNCCIGCHRGPPVLTSSQQAALWRTARVQGGFLGQQRSKQYSQRGAKGQPAGFTSMFGGAPGIEFSLLSRR